MAKAQNAKEIVFHCDLTIPAQYIKTIEEGVAGEGTTAQKITSLAEGTILQLCEGGEMLNAQVMAKLTEAMGERPGTEKIIEKFSSGVGRREGKLELVISLPPEYEPVIAQAAEFQGVTIQQVIQNAWETAWANGDFYDPRPHLHLLAMSNADRDALMNLLGKDFGSGAELADLIQKYIAKETEMFSDLDKG